jgi:fumigallin biosynthesis monooxygenase-like protein
MEPMTRGKQVAIDLTGYPELVVIYLGMRVNTLRGLKTLLGFGPRVKAAVRAQPDGLVLHENITWGIFPPHLGMRQYWRDFDSLERWARTGPHAQWWRGFIKDRGGTGFWHETYLAQGGIEAGYLDMPNDIGLSQFAPHVAKWGSMFSARRRLGIPGQETKPSPLPEAAYDTYLTSPDQTTTTR